MKKELFALLLAIVTLATFQANAQQVRWILADTSGLAKNASHSDSFPNNKSGLYNWLTVDGDSIKVHSQDTNNRNAIYEDGNSKFNFTVNDSDSSFKINRTDGGFFSIEDTTEFEIVQFSDNGRSVQRLDGDTIEGYLAPVQRGTLGSDSANLVLAGTDKNGKLSFKKFSDFAAHLDSVPAAPYLSYQFGGDTVAGRLYQSQKAPYFQVYSRSDTALIGDDNEVVNWSNPDKADSVYAYFDFTLDSTGRVSFKGDTAKDVTLASILRCNNDFGYHVIDTISKDRFNALPLSEQQRKLFIYVEEGNKLAVNAKLSDSTWLTGDERGFFLFPDGGQQQVGYYLNASDTNSNNFMPNLAAIIKVQFGYDPDLNPATNHVERYIYKEGDDWRQLYIKVVPSCDSLPYEYVTSQWLSENYYDIAAVSQEIVGAIGYSVSTDATVADSNAAKFLFEYAATISASDSTINGIGKFLNYKDIELFYIKNGSEYLTVLDTTIFAIPITSSTITNTQLGWEEKLTADSLRQAFAIVYNSKDSSITFLPVASYQWTSTGTTPQYDKTALHYNLNIGKKSPNTCGDLFINSEAWYITHESKTGDPTQRLIIADPKTTFNREIIWFKMTKEYDLAEIGGDCEEDQALAIYDKTGKSYSLTGKEDTVVTDAMIKYHWTVSKTNDGDEVPRWIFAPELDSIYGDESENLKDTFIALNAGDGLIELISGTRSPYRRDTITVRCVGHSSPFLNLDPYVGVSKRVAILESENGKRNISLPDENMDNDSVYEAISKRVGNDNPEAYTKLTVYSSNVQYLGKNNRHQVPYYVFSYKDEESGDEYFLTAQQGIDKDSVRWVKLGEPERVELLQNWKNHKDKYPSFKFCLPYTDGEDHNADSLRFKQPVYLQTLDSSQVSDYSLITGNGNSLESVKFSEALSETDQYVATRGIYSAIEQYKNNIDGNITSWKFFKEDVIGSGWVRIDSVVDAADPQRGKDVAFTNTDNSLPGTVFIVPSSEEPVNYGILTGSDQGNVNVELTLVSAGGAQIGYAKDSIWYYHVKHGDLYLTDAIDSIDTEAGEGHDNEYAYKYFTVELPYAFFTTNKLTEYGSYIAKDAIYADSAFRQTFALQYVEPVKERKNFDFFVVSSANYNDLSPTYRYLSRLDTRLVFVEDKDRDKALQFQWGKVDDSGNYTDIKVIGVPATIYGVAGGIKIANATGAVAIYTIDGRLVTVKAAVSPDQTIAVPAGIYIVRNGANVAKVVVR